MDFWKQHWGKELDPLGERDALWFNQLSWLLGHVLEHLSAVFSGSSQLGPFNWTMNSMNSLQEHSVYVLLATLNDDDDDDNNNNKRNQPNAQV